MGFCIQKAKTYVRIAGASCYLKELGQARDGRKILVNNFNRIDKAVMALFPGYLIPPRLEIERLDPAQIEEIVVKFSPENRFDDALEREEDILKGLSELKGVPRVVGSGMVNVDYYVEGEIPVRGPRPYFVMPKLPGSDLSRFMLRKWEVSPPKREEVAVLASNVFPAIAERLARIHERDIVHRDVKPDNIMFDLEQKSLTLMDFGCANRLGEEAFSFFVGTYGYSPPEIKLTTDKCEDVRTDVYGLGVTCFAILTGQEWLLYEGMDDPAKGLKPPCLWMPPEKTIDRYYEAVMKRAQLNTRDLVLSSNMPAELKETDLARYMAMLFHPAKHKRPTNMWLIAKSLRHLGGRLLQHEIWSSG